MDGASMVRLPTTSAIASQFRNGPVVERRAGADAGMLARTGEWQTASR